MRIVAQTDISLCTNYANRAHYNPASIARPGYIYLFTNGRNQWNNVSGAPSVLTVQASGYLREFHSAFGISLVSDNIGFTQSTNALITYAYRISNGRNWSLSMGLSGGVFSRSFDVSLFDPDLVNDPALANQTDKMLEPDANVGVEFQTNHFIIGLSSTHLFSIGKPDALFLNSNHRYGYVTYKNTDFEMLNYNLGLRVENRYNMTDLVFSSEIRLKNPTGLIAYETREMIGVGLTYRTSQKISFLFGVNVLRNFRVGYAYDINLLPGYSQKGTHEIMLEYRIPIKGDRLFAPRVKGSGNWYD